MTADASADLAVLVAAILTLLAIASKLITANLMQRTKRAMARLEVRRKEAGGRLKEVQLKTTSARGTLEFWERRRTETSQKVQDMQRDVDAYASTLEGGEELEELVEGDDERPLEYDDEPVGEETLEEDPDEALDDDEEAADGTVDEVAGGDAGVERASS
jgi:hypothetical protein